MYLQKQKWQGITGWNIHSLYKQKKDYFVYSAKADEIKMRFVIKYDCAMCELVTVKMINNMGLDGLSFVPNRTSVA